MAVASDSRTLAVAISRGAAPDRATVVRILAVPSGETIREWSMRRGDDVWALAFSPDGKSLAGGIGGTRAEGFYGEVRLWDPSRGNERLTLKGHPNPVMALAFTADGQRLASASGTYGAPFGEVRLWDLATGQLSRTLSKPDEAVVTVAFSPDGQTVASGGTIWREGEVVGGVVTLWDVATGEKRITLPAFPSYVHAVAFAPTGALLATASIGPDREPQVALWDAKSGKALKTLPPGKFAPGITSVKCVRFSPDGHTLAAGGASGMITLWTVNAGE
jgi:WD40 repeat protein